MKITEKQIERFKEELKEFGFDANHYYDFVEISRTTENDFKIIATISDYSLTFSDWGNNSTLTEKCNILKIASKHFKE